MINLDLIAKMDLMMDFFVKEDLMIELHFI